MVKPSQSWDIYHTSEMAEPSHSVGHMPDSVKFDVLINWSRSTFSVLAEERAKNKEPPENSIDEDSSVSEDKNLVVIVTEPNQADDAIAPLVDEKIYITQNRWPESLTFYQILTNKLGIY